MIPKFLEGLKHGSNIVEEMDANVRAPATLLFTRHVEALLREFATLNRTSWADDQDEYWTIFNCNPDEGGRLVSVFVGWMMKQHTAIEKILDCCGRRRAPLEFRSKSKRGHPLFFRCRNKDRCKSAGLAASSS
jgi:hypothetical protein